MLVRKLRLRKGESLTYGLQVRTDQDLNPGLFVSRTQDLNHYPSPSGRSPGSPSSPASHPSYRLQAQGLEGGHRYPPRGSHKVEGARLTRLVPVSMEMTTQCRRQVSKPAVTAQSKGERHSGSVEELPASTWTDEGTAKNSGRGNKEVARLGHILAR